MKCEELLKALNEYVDGTLEPGACTHFQKHLEGCDTCRIVVDNVRKTIQLYKGDQVIELPAECREKLHAKLRERWQQRQG
jgi:anti-sigma factor RsiW